MLEASRDAARRSHTSLLPLVIAALAGLAAALSGAGGGIEQMLHGVRDRLHQHAASGATALVEIDARSLAALNQWPWPRHLHAEAIDRLERAGVAEIAFDVDFSASSADAEDNALASALQKARSPIILATFRQYGSLTGGGTVENLPLPQFRANAQLAAVNIAADPDGLVRHYPYGVFTGGSPRPSIGAMLSSSAGQAGASFPIDGAIDPDTIPRFSFVDLIQDRVPRHALSGKTVVIGATAIELGDRYSVARYGVIPGPVIHLLAAETLRAGTAPVDLGPWLPLALALGLVAMVARRGRVVQFASFAAMVMSLLVGPLFLEIAGLGSPSIIPALTALTLGFIVIAATALLAAFRTARLNDPATGLPNRRGFASETRATPVGTVAALRIDNYSDAASLLGQARAAELIARIADRLSVAGAGTLYRLEDSVLAWTAADADADVQTQAIEGMAAILRAPIEVGGRQIELCCAFGIASGSDVTGDVLADRAILAADHAVENGSRWMVHNDALGEAQDWRLSIAGELDHALAAGHIWVAYQPKLDIATRTTIAAEALVRWQHPQRGPISPDAFIPSLEASGRILDLTLFVLRRAAQDAARWRRDGATINVAVNVSALLATDRAFLDAVDLWLDQGVLDAGSLTLEVTESAALSDPDLAVEALERLSARGIKLSIDDYGTGQSTLSYLKRLPAREIKIDKSFVLGLETNRSDQAMVRSTIGLAHELGYAVVAEGVETPAVLEILAEMNCDVAQGWHIGKPMTADAFAAIVSPMREAA